MSVTGFQHNGNRAARVPRLPNPHAVIPRPRVTELIELGSASAICVVRAPRNFGKSVALGHWARHTSRDTVWLMLTERTSTPELFWQLLTDTIGSHRGLDVTRLAERELLADRLDYISGALAGTQPFTVILEDFRWVQGMGVEQNLAGLLEHTPELSLMIAARAALDLEKIRITLNLDVHSIEPDSLKFTPAEALEFHAGTPLASISAELNDHFQGVPRAHTAARQLAHIPVHPAASHAEHIISRVTDLVRREAILMREQILEPGIEEMLACTLPLEHFDVVLAQKLVPGVDVPSAIRTLVDFGLLTPVYTTHGDRYAYSLFIKNVYTTVLVPEIKRRRPRVLATAAAFEFARRDYSPAFSYAMANKDYRLGTDILLRSGFHLFAEKDGVLHRTLPQIPKTQLAKYPLLTVALAIIYNGDKSTRLKGLEYFALALTATQLLGKSVPPEERLAVSVTQAVALRLTGQFKLAATTARNSLRNANELSLVDKDKLHIFEPIAFSQWALTLLSVGEFGDAAKALHHAVAAGGQLGSDQAKYFAASLLAYRYAVDGDLRTAATFAESAAELFPEIAVVELYQQTPLNMALALIELGQLRPEPAAGHLAKVLTETATSEFWGQLRVIEAKIDLLRGHAGLATGRLDLVLRNKNDLPALNPMDASAINCLRSELLLASGKASGATAVLHKSSAKSAAGELVARARISLALGDAKEVLELLSHDPQFATALQRAEAQTLLTIARLLLQPWDSVRADVESLAGVLTALDNRWPLVFLPVDCLELLCKAVDHFKVPFPALEGLPTASIPLALSIVTLTPRESSILAALAVTGDRAEIAQANFVSLNTVKSQLRSLYRKLGVSTRDEALLVAYRDGLLARTTPQRTIAPRE